MLKEYSSVYRFLVIWLFCIPIAQGGDRAVKKLDSAEIADAYGKQYEGDYFPELESKLQGEQDIPLGPIGGIAKIVFGERKATITELWDKGPGAVSGLKVGDVIVGVNGRKIRTRYGEKEIDGPAGFAEDIAMGMVKAQAGGVPLTLTVKGESEKTVSVALPALPSYGKEFPKDCVRSEVILRSILDQLASQKGKKKKLWPSNQYSSAWCALTLLASGDPKYKAVIEESVQSFKHILDSAVEKQEGEKIMTSHWFMAIIGIFLAEYQLATGDESIIKYVNICSRHFEASVQAGTGRFGHKNMLDSSLPYEGKGLVIINVQAHVLWALAAEIEKRKSWKSWDLSYKAVTAAFSKEGAIGYNFSAATGGQSGGRTGAMAIALKMTGRDKRDMKRMGSWLGDHYHEFTNTHSMTSIGPVLGFIGLKNTNPRAYRKALDDYRWMFSLMTPANFSHGSYYYGRRGNFTGDKYCKLRLTGNWMKGMMLLSQRNDTLWIFGNRKKNWYPVK